MISEDSITSGTIVLNKSLSTVLSPLQAEAFDIKPDSLHPYFYVLPKDLKVKSFITQGHSKHDIRVQSRPETPSTNSFYSSIVLLMFVGILLGKLLYPRRFSQFLRAAFSTKALILLLREWQPIKNILSFILSFIYLSGFTTLILVIFNYLGSSIEITGQIAIDFLIILGGVIFIVAGKYQTIVWLAMLFNVRDSGMRYLTNQIAFGLISTIIFIPLLLVLIYNPSSAAIITGAILISLVQVLRLIRSISVGLAERDINLVYLFLYLCTLEIVPLLLLIKTVSIISSGGSFG